MFPFPSEVLNKEVKQNMGQKHLGYNRNKEETWGVDEADHIDEHLHCDQEGPGEEKDQGGKGCHWPQTSSISCVVFIDGMDHCYE